MSNSTATPTPVDRKAAARKAVMTRRANAAAKAAALAPVTTPDEPTTSPELTMTEEFRTVLDGVREHAATCGRLDCGHLGKSASRAVRRAVILYVAEGSGLTVTLDHESAEVSAVVGVLRTAAHARPVYVKGRTANGGNGYVQHTAGVTLVWPNAEGIKITPQRAEVFGYMVQGYSATDISSDPARFVGGKPAPRVGLTPRNIETVKSHAGYLRRLTGAHDAVSALLALVKAGKITDRAISPTE